MSYPDSFPAANAVNLFGIVRNGQLVERKAEAGWDVWQIQGYGHRVLLGVPAGQSALAVSVLSADDQCTVRNLIQAIEDEKNTVEAAGVEITRERPFLRQLVEQLLPLLLKLLLPTT